MRALFLTFVLAGCGTPGSGVKKTETRAAGGFTAVSVSGAYELELRQGSPASIELEGDDNLMSHYRTEVREGTLHLETEGRVRPKIGPKAWITVPKLTRLDISGAVKGQITELKGEALRIDISGVVELTVSGAITDLQVDVSGASKLRAESLVAQNVKLNASGAGHYDVQAIQTLDVSVSGAATVRYLGEPKLTKDISGVGKVNPL